MSLTGSPFLALAGAILKGFWRDRASVFFALVFPLMFLVLFGGIFSDQDQSKVEMIEVGTVSLFDDLGGDQQQAFDDTFEVDHSDDLDDAIDAVRKGDADVAIEQRGNQLIAHYTQAEQVKSAIVTNTLRAFVDGANIAESGQPPAARPSVRRVNAWQAVM